MKFSLCCGKSACPSLEIEKNLVKIGEEGNLVELKVEEWNALVDLIKEGKVGKI